MPLTAVEKNSDIIYFVQSFSYQLSVGFLFALGACLFLQFLSIRLFLIEIINQ